MFSGEGIGVAWCVIVKIAERVNVLQGLGK